MAGARRGKEVCVPWEPAGEVGAEVRSRWRSCTAAAWQASRAAVRPRTRESSTSGPASTGCDAMRLRGLDMPEVRGRAAGTLRPTLFTLGAMPDLHMVDGKM